MAKGHGNIAAIGTATLNTVWGTNFLSTLSMGTTHTEVSVLKENLRAYKVKFPYYFYSVPSLNGNTSTLFDTNTDLNLKAFQISEGITQDGIYGQSSRNRMSLRVGTSSKGFVRLIPSTSNYINFNDTSAGMIGDATYKLDHSWVTSSTRSALESIASDFKNVTGKKLEINDCSLIDGANTPEHSSHENGKDVDIRNNNLTQTEQTAVLNACAANSSVERILYYSKLGSTSTKIVIDSGHSSHFHVDFI